MKSFGDLLLRTYQAHFPAAASAPAVFLDSQELPFSDAAHGDAEGVLGPALLYFVNSLAQFSIGTRAFPFSLRRDFEGGAVAMPAADEGALHPAVAVAYCQYLWENLYPDPQPDALADLTAIRAQWAGICEQFEPGDEIPEALMEEVYLDMVTGFKLGLATEAAFPAAPTSPGGQL